MQPKCSGWFLVPLSLNWDCPYQEGPYSEKIFVKRIDCTWSERPSCPIMVYVLPAPVWPYAKMDELYPARQFSTIGWPATAMPHTFRSHKCSSSIRKSSSKKGSKSGWDVACKALLHSWMPSNCNRHRMTLFLFIISYGLARLKHLARWIQSELFLTSPVQRRFWPASIFIWAVSNHCKWNNLNLCSGSSSSSSSSSSSTTQMQQQ